MRRLEREGIHVPWTGYDFFGEPEDYQDHIMFCGLTGPGDVVVYSREIGKVFLDFNAAFHPGVRLYFDAHAIIRDGLAVRSGTCAMMVFDCLPLKPYLKLALDETNVPHPNGDKVWTPMLFLEAANRKFFEVMASKMLS